MFWLKGCYYFASHNGFVVWRGLLPCWWMDGRSLPLVSGWMREELSSPGCRHCCLKREEWGWRRRRLGGKLDGEPVRDDVLKWEKIWRKGARPAEKRETRCVMKERRSVLGAAHLTPTSQKTLQWGSLYYVKRGKAGGAGEHWSVITSPAGLLESTVKRSSDAWVPWQDEKFHSV